MKYMLQDRLTRTEYGFLQALAAASRSEDPHTQVGCAIEGHDGGILTTSYNGLKAGVGLHELGFNVEKERERKKDFFIHAELNALRRIKTGEGKVIYCSISPCDACARAIAAWNIKELKYFELYHPSGGASPCMKFKEILWAFGTNVSAATTAEKTRVLAELQKISAKVQASLGYNQKKEQL